ncbi:MAG: SCO family protein [Sporichthyaceae bacterium]
MSRPIAAALLLVALTASCAPPGDVGVHAGHSSSGGFAGTAIQHPYPLPDQAFTDTAGRRFTPAADADRAITLVFFGYTHCPDVCNVVLANIASALRRVDAPVREQVEMVFITTDPDRDTPTVVRGYLDRFDPAYVGLTAPLPTVKAAAASLNIAYAGTEPSTDGGYGVSHGTQVTAFRDGTARVVWSAEMPVKDLRSDLARLAALPS